MSDRPASRFEAFGIRFFASDAVPPGAVLVINPETLRRTLSLESLLGRSLRVDGFDEAEPRPPTVAELLAGFDAKIEAAIARVVRRHREEDLRRVAVAEGWGNGR